MITLARGGARVALLVGTILGLARGAVGAPRVEVNVPARTYYVGQGLELRVGVVAGPERPRAIPPRVADARVTPIPPQPGDRETVVASGIGGVVDQQIHHIFRFRIVPARPGPLVIPPPAVRVGDRLLTGPPVRLTIRPLPPGRPKAFLGGVGTLRVGAEVEPATIRAGQALEYRIRLEGTAARGSAQRPDPAAFGTLPLDPRVEALPEQASDDPPWRIFRFRLRFTRPGEVVLPPIPVAFFDPEAGRYFTLTTPGVPVRVADVPAYDPSALDYGTSAGDPSPRISATPARSRPAAVATAVAATVVALGLLGLGVRFGRRRLARRRRDDPAQVAARLALGIDPEANIDAAVGAIDDALGTYLALASGRPRAVLTPDEARHAFEGLTGDDALADRARRLVADCDEARYGSAGPGPLAGSLVDRARRLIDELGARKVGRKKS